MDYNLEEILGNLYTQEYDDILPPPNTTYDMCKRCENGIDPKYPNEDITDKSYVDSNEVAMITEDRIDRLNRNN